MSNGMIRKVDLHDSLVDEIDGSMNILTPNASSTANAILLDVTLIDSKKYSFKADALSTGNVTI